MMPTFPRSPPIIPYGGFSPVRLEGWPIRRGLSGMSLSSSLLPTCAVRHPVCVRPSCTSWPHRWHRSESGPWARLRTAMRRSTPPTPGALARVRVLVSRSVVTYSTPSAPLAGTSRFHRSAAYTRCLRCAGAPKRPASGSGLSLRILCWHAALFDHGEFDFAKFQDDDVDTAFVESRTTRHSQNSRNPFHAGR